MKYSVIWKKRIRLSIDEFQVIAKYPEGDVEAILRTHIQHCSNAKFIYAGLQRHMMGEIFTSPSRPFYQSTAIMELSPINVDIYTEFIKRHFAENKNCSRNNSRSL